MCLHVLLDKITTADSYVVMSTFFWPVFRNQWKRKPCVYATALVIHAPLKTAREKNCCQWYVHSVKNISVWRGFTFLFTFYRQHNLCWHCLCYTNIVYYTTPLTMDWVNSTITQFLLLYSHRHQDDHNCENLEVRKPRMTATKELVQKIVGQ